MRDDIKIWWTQQVCKSIEESMWVNLVEQSYCKGFNIALHR